MTSIGNALGIQLPPCGSSSDEDVEARATRVGSGASRRSCRDPVVETPPVVGSAAQQEGTEEILAAIDAHMGSDETEILGSDHSGRHTRTPVLFPSDEERSDD